MTTPLLGVAILLANGTLAPADALQAPIAFQAMPADQAGAAPATEPAAPVPATQVPAAPVAPVDPTASAQAAPEAAPPALAEPESVDPDILVMARRRSPGDPLEKLNVQSYKAVQAIDGAFVAPLAKGYKKGLPKPVRDGIHNFLDHVQSPIIFLNFLLQLKPGKAAETLGRFVINSTVGVAGLIDVAKKKPFNLPHRPNSLANTLGYYGVKPGPYFFLPLIGPTTLRDLFGITVDRTLLPITVGTPFNKPYYAIPVNTLSALDYRVAFDDELTVLHTATDPYAATRENYLRKRKAEIAGLHSAEWRALHVRQPYINQITTPPPRVTVPAPGQSTPAMLAPITPTPIAAAPASAPAAVPAPAP